MYTLDSQFIDKYGKCRILNFISDDDTHEDVSIITHPIAPLSNVRIVEDNLYTFSINIRNIGIFLDEINSEISKYDYFTIPGTSSILGVNGVSILGDYEGYIPVSAESRVKYSDIIKNIISSEDIPPFEVETSSKLEKYTRFKDISVYLKAYALYEFSRRGCKLIISNFKIIENYEYTNINTLDGMIDRKNKILYASSGELIVPSENIAKSLIQYCKVQFKTDPHRVKRYVNSKSIDILYSTISDFRKQPRQNIFLDITSLRNYISSETNVRKNLYTIHTQLLDSIRREPYFYKNRNIGTGLVQNTDSESSAVKISEVWRDDGYNSGYNTQEYSNVENVPPHRVFDGVNENITSDDDTLTVIKLSDGMWSAFLPMDFEKM